MQSTYRFYYNTAFASGIVNEPGLVMRDKTTNIHLLGAELDTISAG